MSIDKYSNVVAVIFEEGQSNIDTRAKHVDLPEPFKTHGLAQTKDRVYFKPLERLGGTVTPGSFVDDGEFYTLFTGHDDGLKKTAQNVGETGQTVQIASLTQHGAEIGMSYHLTQAKPNQEFSFIKCAVGASKIETNWKVTTAASDGLWYLGYNYILRPAINDIYKSGKIPVIINMPWYHGESDGETPSEAPNYEARLQILIDRVKYGIGPDTPVTIIGLSNHLNTADWNTVKQAQINVANANANCTHLSTDGATGNVLDPAYSVYPTDTIHHDADGVLGYANRLAQFALIHYENYTPIDAHLCFDAGAKVDHGNVDLATFKLTLDFDVDPSEDWSVPVARGNTGAFIGYSRVTLSQAMRFRAYSGGAGGTYDIPTLSDLSGRHLIYATYDGTTITLFVDGVLQGTANAPGEVFRFKEVGAAATELPYRGRVFQYNVTEFDDTKAIEWDFQSNLGEDIITDTSGLGNDGIIDRALWAGGQPIEINFPPEPENSTLTTDEDTDEILDRSVFPFTDPNGDVLEDVRINTLGKGNIKINGVEQTLPVEFTAAQLDAEEVVFRALPEDSGIPYTTMTFAVRAGGQWSEPTNPDGIVTINVNPIDDKPVSNDSTIEAKENRVYTFKGTEFSITDQEGATIQKALIEAPLPSGLYQLNGADVQVGDEILFEDFTSLEYTADGFGDPYTSIKYRGSDGNSYSDNIGTVAINVTEDFGLIIDTDSEPGRVALPRGKTWPVVDLQPIAGVKVRYRAGYGDTADTVPQNVRDAILLYCAWRYENRAAETNQVPQQFYDLINGERLYLQ